MGAKTGGQSHACIIFHEKKKKIQQYTFDLTNITADISWHLSMSQPPDQEFSPNQSMHLLNITIDLQANEADQAAMNSTLTYIDIDFNKNMARKGRKKR